MAVQDMTNCLPSLLHFKAGERPKFRNKELQPLVISYWNQMVVLLGHDIVLYTQLLTFNYVPNWREGLEPDDYPILLNRLWNLLRCHLTGAAVSHSVIRYLWETRRTVGVMALSDGLHVCGLSLVWYPAFDVGVKQHQKTL